MKKQIERNKIIKGTLRIFFPIFILMIAVTAAKLTLIENVEMKALQTKEWKIIGAQVVNLNNDIQHISFDLTLLSNQREMVDLWNADGMVVPEVLIKLTAEYLSLSIHRGFYDQIRLIDENGMEIIRVNFNDGYPLAAPQDELQNKKDRYYFVDAFALNEGDIFVSPLDLNIEHGEIEQPIKPMIRFAMPVFDQQGIKRGIVLLNYFGEHLLEQFSSKIDTSGDSQIMLLNADGYWLVGPNPQDEWGFMYEDRKDRTFANDYPEGWEIIGTEVSGQFETTQGLFLFKTVYPMIEQQNPSAEAGKSSSPSLAYLQEEYRWIVVSFVPANVLNAGRSNHYMNAALIVASLSAILFLGLRYAVVMDIFRKQAKRELQRSREQHQTTINSMTDFIHVIDQDMQIVLLNKSAEQAFAEFGFSGNLIGKNLFDITPFLAEKVRQEYQQVFEHGEPVITEESTPFDEQAFYTETHKKPIFDDEGEVDQVLTVIHDITERKIVEQKNVRFSRIFEDSLNEIYLFDEDTLKFTQVNRAAQKNLGYTIEELYELTPLDIKPEFTAELFAQWVAPLRKDETEHIVFETVHQRKDKSQYAVEVYLQLLSYEEETLFAAIILDITERKKDKEEILLLNKELEQRVLDRTAELSATIEEIESFSYSVSHDLRAPLRAINGFSEILINEYAETLDDEIKEYLNKIHNSGQNMSELITDLLALSQLSRQKLMLTSFTLDEVADQVFEMQKETINQREIKFHTLSCPSIIADRNQIKILLTNLIANSIKFTQTEQFASIEFGSLDENGRTVFYLRDNGVGFNMAYADKIFAPFQRLHGRDQFEGTGIGLSIAYRIIQNHKGKIWTESEEGVGTTIFFTLGLLIDKQQ